VALDPDSGELIGVARYIRSESDPQIAEVAVSVADERQGQGIGGHLAAALAARAREEGVTTFTALELAENEISLNLLRDLGDLRILRHDAGTVEVSVALAPSRSERTADE
jgi:GNAT superfamily N-acetyltransferase